MRKHRTEAWRETTKCKATLAAMSSAVFFSGQAGLATQAEERKKQSWEMNPSLGVCKSDTAKGSQEQKVPKRSDVINYRQAEN